MSPSRTIDLNADVGEATEPDGVEAERGLLGLVTSAHVACGGHAGTEETMTATVAAALAHSVRVGAHPSYPDTEGFGRRPMDIDRDELRRSLSGQLRALATVCAQAGTEIASVKPHGALYGEVAKGGAIYLLLRAVMAAECPPDTTLVLPSGCPAMAAALRDGTPAIEEGFCDRAYRPDGSLVARSEPGAVLDDPGEAAGQALSLARGAICASDGTILTLWVDTLCIHGDSPGAVAIARAVRGVLEDSGIEVLAPAPA
ncbi:MAG TPA: 5-oxoprolinase subunit PxpA [Acidimicrobiales bacterium]|nr:5-oxoprolinase subunit PxpA [Acidimicrobiales bacterium]